MALTDGNHSATKRNRDRPIGATNRFWSDKQKINAVTTYVLLNGNRALTAKTLGIPEATLITWSRSEWWKDVLEELKKEERVQLSNKLKKIVDASWDVVSERLQNGDYVYDQKTGEMRRKPVSMRDAAKVANDSAILRDKMQGNEAFTVAADQIEDKLNKLAKAFTDLAKGKKFDQPEDIEFVEQVDTEQVDGDNDAISEEWEEGLQDGVPEVSWDPGTKEEPK